MSGLDLLKMRLAFRGMTPMDRMNEAKQWSLEGALKDAYQSESIIDLADEEETVRKCIIAPDRVNPDYDNKSISIQKSAGFHEGTTFYWIETDTYWMVLNQKLTEKAYFKGYIRKCEDSLTINDKLYYVYILGPSQTESASSRGGNAIISEMSYTISLLVSKNEDTLAFFKRFAKIKIKGNTWEVSAVDNITREGIIEVYLKESFNNPLEDLKEEIPVAPINPLVSHILGNRIVYPYDVATYSIALAADGVWSVSNTKAKILNSNSNSATVEIVTGKSGNFDLIYTDNNQVQTSLTVYIESL